MLVKSLFAALLFPPLHMFATATGFHAGKEGMSCMPGSNQDSAIGSKLRRHRTSIQQIEGKWDSRANDVPGVLSCSISFLAFSMIFICLQRDCCTKEELAEDYGGTEAVPFVCQSEEFV
jgi:hypothetical protein